ncbi:MAG: TIGR02099 family protein [Burkholderiaceae bacterium]|nr:TIGR02099 family protein [Burkholderiaceae bacterium]
MSLFTSALAATRRPGRLLRALARWAVGLMLLAWGLVLVAWLVLHWAILPHIDDWRSRIETQASAALGLKLSIGSIQVRSGGWVPAVEMRDLRFSDAHSREVLRLPMVSAALSARSLLAFELRFEQLLIDGPQLEVRRDKQGKIFVAGLSLDDSDRASTDGAELADWFFSQHEFVVLRGTLRWLDEGRDAPPLKLSDVNLVIRNGLRSHQLRLDATPPPQWGERLSLRGRFTQSLLRRPGELRHWSGQLHADLPRADVRELKRHVQLPFELSEGDGALRAWIDVKEGEVVGATVDLALRAVQMRLAPKADAIDLEQIQGRLALQRDSKGLAVTATQLGFVTGDGLVWPRSDLGVKVRQARAKDGSLGAVSGGEFSAQQLDLAVMAQIGSRLPMGEALRQLLVELQAKGMASEVAAQWEGPLDQPSGYKVKTLLSGLSFASHLTGDAKVAGRPGLRNAKLQLSATERGGEGRLLIDQGALELPGVFEDPLVELDKFSAQLNWRIDPQPAGQAPKIELKLSDVKFANADAHGDLTATWTTGPGTGTGRGGRFPGLLDMSGRLDEGRASATARYLPLQIPADTRHWVRDAIQSGSAQDATFKVRGDLWDFPFDAGRQGQFHITAKARDLLFAYVPSHGASDGRPAFESPWPAMERLNADLVFDRSSMEIRNGRARIFGVELSGVKGGIRDLSHDAMLVLDGTGRGPLNEFLRFVRSSPVAEWTGQGLTPATGTGLADLTLGVQIPLSDAARSTVKGSIALAGNELRLRPDVPALANARGRINFSHKGVSLQGVTARALGGDLAIDGGSQADGHLRFTAQGLVTAEALKRSGELGALSRLAQSFNGQTQYRLELGVVRGLTELQLTSNLQGLALDLPAPLRKEAESLLPLRLQTQLAPEFRAAGSSPRDTLRLDLGNLLQLQYQRDLSAAQPRVLRGVIAVQDSLPTLPPSGVHGRANVGAVNVDAWQSLAQRVLGNGSGTAEVLDAGYAPSALTLKAQELQFSGRKLNRLTATINRGSATTAVDQGLWRVNVEAEQLGGYIEYRDARSGAGRVYARLARLSLPKSDAESVESLLDSQPSSVPALDIVIDDFELRGLKLGKLEVEAQHSGAAREWRLSRLQLAQPDATLNATGNWTAETGQARRRAQMDFKMKIADAGNLLERLGLGRVVRGGKGEMSGQVGWLGSPLSPDYPSMTGQVAVALDAGQFLKADPGVGRLLGVLSLQSLPRRFTLDFRDLFQEGFAFDSFSGNVKIQQGLASTNNLRMRGVSAVVLTEGQTDLAREIQDLRIIVVPEISATTASLAYAAINPAIGLGTLFAQLLLRKPMMAAGTREFHVTGSWADPKVERVERKVEGAAEAASAPTN